MSEVRGLDGKFCFKWRGEGMSLDLFNSSFFPEKQTMILHRRDFKKWDSKKLKKYYNEKKYRTIIINAMGTDLFPIHSARRLGFNIKIIGDYCSTEVAEHALNLEQKLVEKTGEQPKGYTLIVGSEGRIGSKINRMLRFKREVKTFDIAKNQSFFELRDLLKKAGVVFVCIPLNRKTVRFFSGIDLDAMESSPLVVNVSGRNELFNSLELTRLLKRGFIAGYAVDEVPPRCLRELDNVYFSEHVGWRSSDSLKRRHVLLSEAFGEV